MSIKHDTSVKPDPQHLNYLLQYLSSYHPLTEELRASISDKLFEVKARKGQHLLQQGELSEYFYFIVSGVIIGYTTRKGKKLTTYICLDGDSVSSISGMYGDGPSEESIYVVEDSHLIGFPSTELVHWLQSSFAMNVIIRKILEAFYKAAHERSTLVRMGSAEDKYKYYLSVAPNHVKRIPLEYIADFLDIKPKTLQRILKEQEKEQENILMVKQKCQKIDEYMTRQQAFKSHGLTLSKAAEALGVPPHELSYILNVHYKKGFNAFVNEHRVNYIKERLQNEAHWKHLKMEAMGTEGGFSSRSSFFSEFKNVVGMSPAEFAKTLKRSSPDL